MTYDSVSLHKIYIRGLKNAWVYLSPSLIESSGEQEIVLGQLGDLCCLLSRNHPESTSPRTWASAPSSSSWLATRSIFSKTPVPPALQGNQEKDKYFGFEIGIFVRAIKVASHAS